MSEIKLSMCLQHVHVSLHAYVHRFKYQCHRCEVAYRYMLQSFSLSSCRNTQLPSYVLQMKYVQSLEMKKTLSLIVFHASLSKAAQRFDLLSEQTHSLPTLSLSLLQTHFCCCKWDSNQGVCTTSSRLKDYH